MHRITITEVDGLTGEYALDESRFDGHELHLIKKVSGATLGTVDKALREGDYDVIVAFAVIALWRAGKASKENAQWLAERLLGESVGKIRMEELADELAVDERPPTSATTPGSESSNGESVVANESSPPSSPDSSDIGGISPENSPSPTGPLGLVSSA